MDEPWQLALYKRVAERRLRRIFKESGAKVLMELFDMAYEEALEKRLEAEAK